MKQSVAFLVFAVLLAGPSVAEVERVTRGQLVIEGIPEIPPELIERMRRYQNARSATFADWTPAGGVMVSTRFGNTAQLHVVDRPLGQRRQISFFEEPITGGLWSPTGARRGVAIVRDEGGDENYQLEYLDPARGEAARLTDGRGRVEAGIWSADGRRIAFNWVVRNAASSDVYVDDPEDGSPPERVLDVEGPGWEVVDWSPAGEQLLLLRFVSVNESYVHVYDLATKSLQEIEPSSGKASRPSALFSHDGKGVYFLSDLGSEFLTLRRAELADGRVTPVAGGTWDIEEIAVSDDGRHLAWVANEDGASRLSIRDLRNGRDLPTPPLPFGLVDGIAFDDAGGRLAFSFQTPTQPWDVWTWDLARRELVRWTHSELGPVDPARFAEPALVRYPSFDQVDGKPRQIPAWIYRPRGEGPHPVLVNIHGGPESQARPIFSTSIQQWAAELGYAVIAPNVRGSTGYGKTYVALDNGMKREDSVRDIGALLDWIATQPDLDASRVVVTGGSYGGYMSLASMVHFNDRLRGGVDVVGISNFVTFLESTAEYRRDLRRPEYGDERDPEMRAFLERISPLNNAGKISKPMLIVQGQNDPRVPVTESEQMVAKIRANGGEVWYLVGLNEGHGFRRRENVDYYQWAVALFLQKLKGDRAL